jgi:hypothetical protein
MKKVVPKGIHGQTKPQPVPRDKIEEHRAGWFHFTSSSNEDGDPVVITFTPELLVDEKVTQAELAPVVRHERVHEADFSAAGRAIEDVARGGV